MLTSTERDWLRAMTPIAPQAEAMPLAALLLEANFDRTREVRYAFQNGLLWAMYQHRFSTLTTEDLSLAVEQLHQLHTSRLTQVFDDLIGAKLQQIVVALKAQDQSLEEALQLLERLYEEGVLGTLEDNREDREVTLAVWRHKLTRLWQDGQPHP